jgi:hypothetical protein
MTEEFPEEDYRFKRKSSSSQPDQVAQSNAPNEGFEEVDYVAMRKEQPVSTSSPMPTYQPVSTPAWDKHVTEGHKVGRFNRLTTWDRRKRVVKAIVFWLVLLFALGGLSYAYQNKLHMQLIVPSAPSNYQPQ